MSQATGAARRLARVPEQIEMGLELRSKDRKTIVKRIEWWQRSKRAPWDATELAIARALYQGCEFRNGQGYRSHKTLAHDAGLGPRLAEIEERDPKKRAELEHHESERARRIYMQGFRELEADGLVRREYFKAFSERNAPFKCSAPEMPKEPGQRWSVPAAGLCNCPWHHGCVVWTLGVHTLAELEELGRLAIAQRGDRLQRPLHRKRASARKPQGPTPNRRRKATRATERPPSMLARDLSNPEGLAKSQITSTEASLDVISNAPFGSQAPAFEITSISVPPSSLKLETEPPPPSPGTRTPAPARALRAEDDSAPHGEPTTEAAQADAGPPARAPWPPSPPAPEPERAVGEVAATGGPTSAPSTDAGAVARETDARWVLEAYRRTFARDFIGAAPRPYELAPILAMLREGYSKAALALVFPAAAKSYRNNDPGRRTLRYLMQPQVIETLLERACAAEVPQAAKPTAAPANDAGGSGATRCASCEGPSLDGALCAACAERDYEAKRLEDAYKREKAQRARELREAGRNAARAWAGEEMPAPPATPADNRLAGLQARYELARLTGDAEELELVAAELARLGGAP